MGLSKPNGCAKAWASEREAVHVNFPMSPTDHANFTDAIRQHMADHFKNQSCKRAEPQSQIHLPHPPFSTFVEALILCTSYYNWLMVRSSNINLLRFSVCSLERWKFSIFFYESKSWIWTHNNSSPVSNLDNKQKVILFRLLQKQDNIRKGF